LIIDNVINMGCGFGATFGKVASKKKLKRKDVGGVKVK